MYRLRKKPYFIIVILLALIGVFLFFVMSNSDKKVAKEFLKLYYTVSDTNIYRRDDINEIETALSSKYRNVLTYNALKKSVANRSIMEGEQASDKWKCTLTVKKVTLKLVDSNSISKSYDYTVNARVKFADGNEKYISPTGTLKLVKEANKWKVDAFYTIIGELYKLMGK